MNNAADTVVENSRSVNLSEDILKRFWAKVNKTESCWLWTASTTLHGYGQFFTKSGHDVAHRVSWKIHFGAIPKGEGFHGTCVCHRCDNKICVNPDHLFLGSQRDNLADMTQKGHRRDTKG